MAFGEPPIFYNTGHTTDWRQYYPAYPAYQVGKVTVKPITGSPNPFTTAVPPAPLSKEQLKLQIAQYEAQIAILQAQCDLLYPEEEVVVEEVVSCPNCQDACVAVDDYVCESCRERM